MYMKYYNPNRNFESLSGSRIALVGPNFFSYIDSIRLKMLEYDIHAEFFDERHINTPIGKAFYRLGIYRLFNRRRRAHLNSIVARLISGNFSDVLLIDVEVVDRPFVQCLVDAGLNVHIYMWDSAMNKPGYVKFLDILKGKASFDPEDCRQYGLVYIPLFAEDVYSANFPEKVFSSSGEVADICFCGTLHSNRAKKLAELERYCKVKSIRLSMLLYFHAKWMFVLKSILVVSNLKFINRISSKGYSKTQISELFKSSMFVFDLHHPGQAGLTARTFEVLRSGSRLITFNEQARSLLPASLAHRVVVIEKVGDLDRINFKNTPPLTMLTIEEDHYLSISRFVEDIIKLISTARSS